MSTSISAPSEKELTERYAKENVHLPIFEVGRDFGGRVGPIKDKYFIDVFVPREGPDMLVEAKKFKVGSNGRLIHSSYHDGVGQALNYTRESNNVELWHFYCGDDEDSVLPIVKEGHEVVQEILDQAEPNIRLRSIPVIDGEISSEVFK